MCGQWKIDEYHPEKKKKSVILNTFAEARNDDARGVE